MVKLIDILSEQIESNSSQVEKRLRTLFSAMQDVKGIDNVVGCVSLKKSKELCMMHNHDHIKTQTEVLSLLRLFGYNALDKMRFDQFDMFYWLATCFIANGGYARTFSQGPLEAVNLEIKVREMQAEYDEEQINTREGWGDLYDMSDDEDAKEYYLDKTDKSGRFVAVTVRFKEKLKTPITLENIKMNKKLSHLSLIKQSRLSVMSIDSKSWKILNNMGRINL